MGCDLPNEVQRTIGAYGDVNIAADLGRIITSWRKLCDSFRKSRMTDTSPNFEKHIEIDQNYVVNMFLVRSCRSVKNMATYMTLNYEHFLIQFTRYLGEVGQMYCKLYDVYNGFILAADAGDVFTGRGVLETAYHATQFIFEAQVIACAKKLIVMSNKNEYCNLKMRILSRNGFGDEPHVRVEFYHTRTTPMGASMISVPSTYTHDFSGYQRHGGAAIVVSLAQVRDRFSLEADGSEDFPYGEGIANRPFSTEELIQQEERYFELYYENEEQTDDDRFGEDGPPDHLLHPNQVLHPLRFDYTNMDVLLPYNAPPVYTAAELLAHDERMRAEAIEFRSWTRHFDPNDDNPDPLWERP